MVDHLLCLHSLEHMMLLCIEPDHRSLNNIIVYLDWQEFSRISSRSLSDHLILLAGDASD